MKNLYQLQLMNQGDYYAYMSGSNNYHVMTVEMVAENENQAIEAAKHYWPEMVINEGYVVLVEADFGNADVKMHEIRAEIIDKLKDEVADINLQIERLKARIPALIDRIEELDAEDN